MTPLSQILGQILGGRLSPELGAYARGEVRNAPTGQRSRLTFDEAAAEIRAAGNLVEFDGTTWTADGLLQNDTDPWSPMSMSELGLRLLFRVPYVLLRDGDRRLVLALALLYPPEP